MISCSLPETKEFAREFLMGLSPQKSGATVVALHGDLGSGKTAFVQCVAKLLGVRDYITSPTFIIMKRFMIRDSQFANLVHIDAYRLDKPKELRDLGWDDIVKNPANLVFIEWPERVEKILPVATHKLYFKFTDDTTREISFQ